MKIIKSSITIFILLISILSINKVINNIKNKEVVLDEVKLKEEIKVDKNTFGIYIEKNSYESEEDKYTTFDGDTWPVGYVLNKSKSGCIDARGELIDNALDYEEGIMTTTTSSTCYCYIYFDINS